MNPPPPCAPPLEIGLPGRISFFPRWCSSGLRLDGERTIVRVRCHPPSTKDRAVPLSAIRGAEQTHPPCPRRRPPGEPTHPPCPADVQRGNPHPPCPVDATGGTHPSSMPRRRRPGEPTHPPCP